MDSHVSYSFGVKPQEMQSFTSPGTDFTCLKNVWIDQLINISFSLGPCAYNPDMVNTSISHSFGVKHKDDHIDRTPGKID